jgi:hypothetical protein
MFRMSTRPVGANDELFQRREGRWRKDLVADACNYGPIALTVIADLMPG